MILPVFGLPSYLDLPDELIFLQQKVTFVFVATALIRRVFKPLEAICSQ